MSDCGGILYDRALLPSITILSALNKYSDFLRGSFFNCMSLLKNFDEMSYLISRTKLDFFCFAETFLTEEIQHEILNINGYSLIRKDRPHPPLGYGGICIYVKSSLKYRVITLPNQIFTNIKSFLEYLFIEIYIGTRKILLCCFYNPPPSSNRSYHSFKSSIGDIETILSYFTLKYNDIVVTGDFNFDLLKPNDTLTKLYVSTISSINFNFKNCTEPTHFMQHPSLIDHVISSHTDLIPFINQVSICLGSHHDFMFFAVDCLSPEVPKYIYYRNFNMINSTLLFEMVDSCPWSNLYNCADSDSMIDLFNNYINTIFQQCVPLKRKILTNKRPFWFNDNIVSMISKRNKAYRKWKISQDSLDWDSYKYLRNRVVCEIKLAKANYLNSFLDPCLPSKLFWGNVRKLGLNKKKNQ